MNPKILLEGDVLEVAGRDYVAKDGSNRTYRSCLFRLDGKVLRFGVAQAGFDALKAEEGHSNVTIVVELSTFGDNLEPRLSVVGVGKE